MRSERVLGDDAIHAPQPKGSRFSERSYGVYYAADRLSTAIAETAHHFASFARESPLRRHEADLTDGVTSARVDELLELNQRIPTAGLVETCSKRSIGG